jgi:glycosyltransferase involved in cell wall biosynthesis
MVGVYADGKVHGGICTVIDQYLHSPIAATYRILLSGNSTTGGPLRKAAAFLCGCMVLARNCAFGKISLVHLHTASGTSFYRKATCFLIAKMFGKKTIVHIHGGGFVEFHAASGPAGRRLIGFVLDHADTIIVLSESFRQRIGALTHNRTVKVVFNPVRVSDFRKEGKRNAEPVHLLFVGDVIERKGVAELIAAMQIVLDTVPSAKLTLCGGGRIAFYRKLCSDLKISDSVEFAGFVSGEAKLSAFSNASLFVLPSYVEGMPMVIIEAMAAGLPVVATAVGGVPEIIEEGVNGFLVAPRDPAALADRILRIVSDPARYDAMSAANVRKAGEVFDITAIAAEICGIYEEVLNR